MANLTDMLSKFVTANTASTSGSGTIMYTVTNPKEDLKGITTRSGVTIQGPKTVNHDTEVTKDTMPPANNGSTEDVQPPGSEAITLQFGISNFEITRQLHSHDGKQDDVIDMLVRILLKKSCFPDIIASGNYTPYYDPINCYFFTYLTPCGDSDFLLLEEPTLSWRQQVPVIIAKELDDEKIPRLVKVLKSPLASSRLKLLTSEVENTNGSPLRATSRLWEFFPKLLSRLDHMLKDLTESSNLDWLQTGLPFELMCDASDFAIGAVLGQRHEKHFWPIHYASKTLIEAQTNYTTTEKELLAIVYASEKCQYPRRDAPGGFSSTKNLDFKLLIQKEPRTSQPIIVQIGKPYENVNDPKEINESFPLETLNMVTFRGDSRTPSLGRLANYHAVDSL
ncbi:reverse transcriptase domain-containing protein [Tanacetum coccineum]